MSNNISSPNKDFTGQYIRFNENNLKILEAGYKDGKRNGMKRSWYGTGERKSCKCYKNGKLSGQQIRWFQNGDIKYNKYVL